MSWSGIDLRQAGAEVVVVHLTELLDELLLALLRELDAQVGKPRRERLHVLPRRVDEEARQLRHVGVRELACLAEVDEAERAVREPQDVRRMRVGVEEPVPEDHRHPGLGDRVGEAHDAPRPASRSCRDRAIFSPSRYSSVRTRAPE